MDENRAVLDKGFTNWYISTYGEITYRQGEVGMFAFMMITKALSDENRVRMLLALDGRELCVCQIVELLGLAPSTVSKHMSILANARLVENRQDGRWRYYRLAGVEAPNEVREAIAWALRSLSKTPRIKQDAEHVKEILKLDPEVLCKA
ncbi:MAG: winged helix-turn-helix transcriptional regulator [Desulfobacterales bacterium]|nr:MAG: winged helix-turn-helix transcriptional regulator [Desulfobacterales bacterium]